MKLIITADWHFNENNRLPDFVQAANKVVDYALSLPGKDTHFMLLGDVYENWSPTTTERDAFYSVISRLQRAGVPVSIVMGNHDVNDRCLDSMQYCFREFDDLQCPGIALITEPKVVNYGSSSVLHIPHLSKFQLQGKDYKDAFVKTLTDNPADLVVAHILMWDAIEGPVGPSPRGVSTSDVLNNCRGHFIAGDIHANTVLRDSPLVAYTGSLTTNTFNEALVDHGFYVYDTESHDIIRHPISSRTFTDITADFDTKEIVVKSRRAGAKPRTTTLPSTGTETDIVVSVVHSNAENISESVVKLRVYGHKNILDRIDRLRVVSELKDLTPFSIAGVSFEYSDNTAVRCRDIAGRILETDAFTLWHGNQGYTEPALKDGVYSAGMGVLKHAN